MASVRSPDALARDPFELDRLAEELAARESSKRLNGTHSTNPDYDDDDEAADPPLGGLLDRREMLRALRLVLRQFRRIERLDVYADYPKLPWSYRTTEAPQLRTLTIRSRTWMDGPMLDYLNGLKMPNLESFHSWTNPLALRRFIRPTLVHGCSPV